jgi:hypothetical protein
MLGVPRDWNSQQEKEPEPGAVREIRIAKNSADRPNENWEKKIPCAEVSRTKRKPVRKNESAVAGKIFDKNWPPR